MLQATLGPLVDLVKNYQCAQCQSHSIEIVNQFVISGSNYAQQITRAVEDQWESHSGKNCEHCSSNMQIQSVNPPSIIWLNVQGRSTLSANEFPPFISIKSYTFAIRGFIIHRPGHYSSVIRFQDTFFSYDDLKKASVTTYRGGYVKLNAILLVRVQSLVCE